jgi:hypothetical protein
MLAIPRKVCVYVYPRTSHPTNNTKFLSFFRKLSIFFFLRVFRSTALNLQEKAEAVYQREREYRERHPQSLSAGGTRRSSFAPTSPGR